MSKINTFLQKRKMHENQHGIFMVITAYVLSFLMLVLGSDVFYNINSSAAGINNNTDEATQKMVNMELLGPQMIGITPGKFQTNFINPYGLEVKDNDKKELPESVAAGTTGVDDTVWLLGQAMNGTEYNNAISSMGNSLAQDGKLARKLEKGSIESFAKPSVARAASLKLSKDDVVMLERIVESEASGEDMIGRILIANVIFNRIYDDEFPDTVKDVIFQKVDGDYQFSPVSDQRFWSVKISKKTEEAVTRALDGEDYSEGALYFMARTLAKKTNARWFDNNLEWLFKHGGHEFYK
ncbi:MAG TPA: cell wall hydrolase [Mobilitalea sp.]|nr:cell wall hydrolase [Mobilitalea sp.]